MKKILQTSLVLLVLLSAFGTVKAQVDVITPKREMRSAWVATVWGIDWPLSTTDGSESSISTQKKQMTRMLDSLAVNNFNAVNFQVRGMCDAMYKSSYEPWASWLTGTRGKNPGWDPFEFFVTECHKRGLECHAWVNPYRFNSSSTSGGSAGDGTGYVENGWVIQGASGGILNPGLPEVQARIVDVCKEIITKYDVDGMLFDDYYYNGAALSEDADNYSAYTAAGGELSQADWRRKNVTDLMRKLYKMIADTKPWVRFGQAPQGATYTNQTLADKYGIEKCPAAYDNNYGSQYIDIMEWLDNGLIDFISPQVYWTIGHTTDYSKLVPWWSYIVDHFDRHLFVSQSISSLSGSSDVSAPTSAMGGDQVLADIDNASGPNNTTFAEYVNQIKLNRSSSINGSCGSVFYSVKYIYNISSKISFGHYLKRHVFSRAALMPAMTWKTQATDPGKVQNLVFDESTQLTWDALPNMRYSVYAVPNGVSPDAFNYEVDYLLGVTYGTQYTIPEDYRSGHYFAVCAYDRYGNEWAPAVWTKSYSETLDAPQLISPADGFTTDSDFTFQWSAVTGAEKYTVDFAADAEFKNMMKSIQVTDTKLDLSSVYNYITKNVDVYWRIHSVAKGKNDGVSATRKFHFNLVQMLTPVSGTTDLEPQVEFTWTAGDDTEATLEVATDEAFSDIKLTAKSTTGSYKAKVLELHPLTLYFARVTMRGKTSDFVSFKTKAMPCQVPEFANPVNGGICYNDANIEIVPQDGAEFVTIQVDLTDAFGASKAQKQLSDFATGVPASAIKISKRNPMTDGTTYYARAYVKYYDEEGILRQTDWSDVISFVYKNVSSGISDVTAADAEIVVEGDVLYISSPAQSSISVSAVNMLGVATQVYAGVSDYAEISLRDLAPGMYVIKASVGGETYAVKMIKR